MTNVASKQFALDIEQAANLIAQVGKKLTVIVEGDIGCGKSSLLTLLAEKFPDHTPLYFDGTTKDLGDMMIPHIVEPGEEHDGCVRFLTNEELGLHLNKPVILMFDEAGKMNPAVLNASLRVWLERAMGAYKLHPDSLVFATTNLGAENVGDMFQPHHLNRVCRVRQRKSTNEEWLVNFAIPNNLHPAVLGWAKDNPQLFYSFTDVPNPDDNPYIYHPSEQRDAFVSPRSLEKASDILWEKDKMDNISLTAALIGTIGTRGALDLMAYVTMADELPRLADIKESPTTATVPTSAAAVCMVAFRTLSSIERDWMDAWMVYLDRLSTEAQAIFVNGVRSPKYAKQSMVMSNKKFTDWAIKHQYLFSADKV